MIFLMLLLMSYGESLFSMDDTDSDPNFIPVGISDSESDLDITIFLRKLITLIFITYT